MNDQKAWNTGDFYLVPREIIDQFPEINVNNYGHDDACALNTWGFEVVTNANPAPVQLSSFGNVDLPTRLATDIANAFKYKAKQLGAEVSVENLRDVHSYVQGTISDAITSTGPQVLPAESARLAHQISRGTLFLRLDDGPPLPSYTLKDSERQAIIAALRAQPQQSAAPVDPCPYAIDGCVLEKQEVGPCLCANPVQRLSAVTDQVVWAAKAEAAFVLADEIKLRKQLTVALRDLLAAVKAEPAMQGRQFVQLGIQVTNVLHAADVRERQWGGTEAQPQASHVIAQPQPAGMSTALEDVSNWLEGCLQCKTWSWDGLQRDAAEAALKEARAALALTRPEQP